MVCHVYDYMTLVCKIERPVFTCEEVLHKALKTLHILDIWNKFEHVGRNKYYAFIYRFNDISVKVPSEERFLKQGICIEFSGNAMAYYQAHLKEKGLTLRHACRAWRALSVGGVFTYPTRFDYAVDEICHNSEKPIVTFEKVKRCIDRCEVRTRLTSPNRQKIDLSVPVDFDCLVDPRTGELVGGTTYFGKRESGAVVVRFYDKLLERKCKKVDTDEDITSWFRVEYEMHKARAMAAFNAFCDNTEEEFVKYMAGVMNTYVCFINRDDSNVSRCSIKKWWVDFIGTSEKCRLVIPPYRPAAFQRTARWLHHSVFPTLCRYIMCIGLPAFLRQLQEAFQELANTTETFRHKQLRNDFKTIMHQREQARKELYNGTYNPDVKSAKEVYDDHVKRLGLDPWIFTSLDPDNALNRLQEEYNRYILGDGSAWHFDDVETPAEELHFSYSDFPPESIFGADCNNAYFDDIDEFIMSSFVNGSCC